MSHITGGGITGNLARVFPKHLAAEVKLANLPKTKLLEWMQNSANLTHAQMLETFNCGIGYAIVVDKNIVDKTLAIIANHNIKAYNLGVVVKRSGTEVVYK